MRFLKPFGQGQAQPLQIQFFVEAPLEAAQNVGAALAGATNCFKTLFGQG